ncbi:MAG: restriction endonuclease [Luteimonas sp.]
MGRGRRGFFDDLIKLPWPVALVVGVIGYAVIRHGVPAFFARQDGPYAHALANASTSLAPLAWMFLAACALCALVAFANARKRRRLLDTRTSLDSLAAIGWRDFERLVGEAFRRQGYSVEETGLGGADGGIDLILRKHGQRTLVQCKQWRREKVPVNVVREMYGLLAHHGAHAVRIATVGGFTQDAARFAAGKPIALIDGATLLAMIREVQNADRTPASAPPPMPAPRIEPAFATAAPAIAATPNCPRCGSAMVERTNRRANSTFLGCTTFPICRGTR